MEINEIHYISYSIDIWCDCGHQFTIAGNDSDSECPECGAVYGMLPARIDGA